MQPRPHDCAVPAPWSAADTLDAQRDANEQLVLNTLRVEDEAESARRTLIDASASVALLRGADFVIDFANPRILELWGRTSADVIGRPLLDAMPELHGQGFDELLAEVMRTGVPFVGSEMPARILRHGKLETCFFNFAYTATRDAANPERIDGVSIIAFDATPQAVARKRIALSARVGRSLSAQRDLAEQLAECCDALVDFGAASARIWLCNASGDALELRASAGISTQPDRADARAAIGAGLVGTTASRRAMFVTCSLGEDGDAAEQDWARREGLNAFAGCPLVVGDRLLGVVALFGKDGFAEQDETTLSSVADHIALGVDRDNSDRFRELFVGMLAHDLRSPLNAISMGSHLLADDVNLSAPSARTVRRVQASADRMGRMIAQLLDFTRARSGGGMPIDRRSCDVHVVCAQALGELRDWNPQRVVEASYAGDTRGEWDPDRLVQVFSNLVGNALKHGARDAPVRVEIDGTGAAVRFRVRNLGDPIPDELLATMFDPFRQGRGPRGDGFGLGLFIAQQIVVAHGGRIHVRSSAGEGTEVSFELPRLVA